MEGSGFRFGSHHYLVVVGDSINFHTLYLLTQEFMSLPKTYPKQFPQAVYKDC